MVVLHTSTHALVAPHDFEFVYEEFISKKQITKANKHNKTKEKHDDVKTLMFQSLGSVRFVCFFNRDSYACRGCVYLFVYF